MYTRDLADPDGHRRAGEPLLSELAKTLSLFQAALLALLLDGRRTSLANSALRVEALFSGQRERDSAASIPAEIDRLTAPFCSPAEKRSRHSA